MIAFGPIPSRRLGRSLGINNITAPKVCSYDCIYCQVGKTRRCTSQREKFFSPEAIYNAVSKHLEKLASEDRPDYLTFVANGEPTLDLNLGKSISLLKSNGIPIAVLTNGSLLGDSSIVEELSSADWVSVKIDAADMEVWQQINRPSKGLNFDSMLSGIFNFFRSYNGISCTETMLIEGVNDSESHLERLSGIIHDINPSKAYISIPTRPPAEKSVKTPSEETLNLAWHMISRSGVNTELLTGFEGTSAGFTGNAYEDILNITAVHPLREDTLITLLEKDMADWQIVESLISQRLIKSVGYEGRRYFLRQYNS